MEQSPSPELSFIQCSTDLQSCRVRTAVEQLFLPPQHPPPRNNKFTGTTSARPKRRRRVLDLRFGSDRFAATFKTLFFPPRPVGADSRSASRCAAVDLYLFFAPPPLARTPAELPNQTRHSNREKGITQREIHSHLDYLWMWTPPDPRTLRLPLGWSFGRLVDGFHVMDGCI